MGRIGRRIRRFRGAIERIGFALRYRLADWTYALGVARPKQTVAGRYWSYEPTNAHGNDLGLKALSELPDDANIIDIGGHAGEYAVPLAVETDRSVTTFEPNGESADRLERTVERNGVASRVDVRRMGLGSVDDERPFYRSTFSKLSAFDREAAGRWGADVEAIETVPVRRLDSLVDDIIPPPNGLKIDVEGSELDVLAGATETVEAYRPLSVVEIHDESLDKTVETWFTERGYAVEMQERTLICHPPAAKTERDSRRSP